jgi:hypothetical protein
MVFFLNKRGHVVNRKRVQDLMREMGEFFVEGGDVEGANRLIDTSFVPSRSASLLKMPCLPLVGVEKRTDIVRFLFKTASSSSLLLRSKSGILTLAA